WRAAGRSGRRGWVPGRSGHAVPRGTDVRYGRGWSAGPGPTPDRRTPPRSRDSAVRTAPAAPTADRRRTDRRRRPVRPAGKRWPSRRPPLHTPPPIPGRGEPATAAAVSCPPSVGRLVVGLDRLGPSTVLGVAGATGVDAFRLDLVFQVIDQIGQFVTFVSVGGSGSVSIEFIGSHGSSFIRDHLSDYPRELIDKRAEGRP